MGKKWKQWIKRLSPIALSKNHRYDRWTKKIIARYCSPSSNCVDVGCHDGEVLDLFLKYAPNGQHFAFEPIPALYLRLKKRYAKYPRCQLFDYALSDQEGTTTFNHVLSNPAYSGLLKRRYDREGEKDETINVVQKKLDSIIPVATPIDFIKIDAEGGDMDVMLGAKRIIASSQALIVFEFGIGGSDVYGATPEALYDYLSEMGYQISLLDRFLQKAPPLSRDAFIQQFEQKLNYYFIAHPARLHQ